MVGFLAPVRLRRTYRGADGAYLTDELEVGRRAACWLAVEAQGWGAWLDTSHSFELQLQLPRFVWSLDWRRDRVPRHGPGPRVPQQRKPSD